MCASSRTKGYLTVFLSLTITIIMSLVLALFQGARIGAVKLKTEAVADIAMNSVLAEYNRQLYEQYGLLMVDTSYGRANPSIVNTQEHLKHYVQKNFDRSTAGRLMNAQTITSMYCEDAMITGSSFATDNDFTVLERQILAYMGADPAGGLMTDVLANADMVKESGLDTTDVEEMARANQEAIDAVELPKIINEEGEEEEVALGNPADAVNSQKGIGALNLAVKSLGSISNAYVDTALLPSRRALNKGTGLRDEENLSASKKLLLEQYYYEKCSRYGQELEKSVLKYQLEYLIYGQGSDHKNLEKMSGTLLFWREAANMLYLFSCEPKCAEAEAAALVLTAVILMPELKDLVKYSILFAWTFAESISDLNILFSGGQVPLFKTDATWRLSLMNMLSFRNFLNGGTLGEGLYYKDYVRIRLFFEPAREKLKRMGDVIEMDVRNSMGNRNFRLDYCLDAFCAEISVGTSYGYEVKIERIYGYEE